MLRSLTRRKSAFALVVMEMASGFTILACLLTLASYYLDIKDQPSGHHEADLVRVVVQQPAATSDPATALAAAHDRRRQTLDRLRALPGVEGAVPMTSTMLDHAFVFPTQWTGTPPPARPGGGATTSALGYLVRTERAAVDLLGLRLVEGAVPPAEAGDQVIVTRCLRDRLFPGAASVLGASLSGDDGSRLRVGGVVEDVLMLTPLLPHAGCLAFDFSALVDERRAQYLVRAQSGRRAQVLAAVRAALGTSAGDRYVMVEPFDTSTGLHGGLVRALVLILGIMGVVVALVALLGALAVSSFLVAERTNQIGIRRALGARRRDVVAYFLIENTIATALGTVLGLGFTVALFLLMRQAFSDVQLRPGHLAVVAGLLWLDGMLAALLPARRAAQIPPSVASRAA